MNTKPGFSILFFLFCFLISCLPLSSLAADKVVVIPLFGHGKTLKNVVTVAKSGGKFTDPVAAVNSITDASANNPYLVVIGPGVYTLTQTLVMKPWVDVTGSGENVTKLTGTISNSGIFSSAVVKGADNVMLSNITIINRGGGQYSIGISTDHLSSTFVLWRVSAEAAGGMNNYGIRNYYSTATITEVSTSAYDGHSNIALANIYSSLIMERVQATAAGNSSSFNDGILNMHCNPKMTDITTEALNGLTNSGVRNNAASPQMKRIDAKGWGGVNNFGVYNQSGYCSPDIRRCSIIGSTYGLYTINSTGRSFFSQSTISGGVNVSGTATAKCVACDGNYNALAENCQ